MSSNGRVFVGMIAVASWRDCLAAILAGSAGLLWLGSCRLLGGIEGMRCCCHFQCIGTEKYGIVYFWLLCVACIIDGFNFSALWFVVDNGFGKAAAKNVLFVTQWNPVHHSNFSTGSRYHMEYVGYVPQNSWY